MMSENNSFLRVILNCSGHSVLPGQKQSVEKLMSWSSSDVLDIVLGNVPENHNFVSTIIQAIGRVRLSQEEWQTTSFVVIPAGYSAIWSVVLAELHGRLGYFPDVVRLRPAPSGSSEKYEVAEIMSLQQLRHESRGKR